MTCFLQCGTVPNELADNPGKLKWICNVTGGLREYIDIDIIKSEKITVTNWGDAPSVGVAEGAFALMMAVLKDVRVFIEHADNGGFNWPENLRIGQLANAKIGIFGMGYIARRFVEYLRPFEPIISAYDPFVNDFPAGVEKVSSLEELFEKSQIIVVHAGLTDETRGIINAELLGKLPDGGVIINTARGAIIDTEALEKECTSGRLRAGLDVLAPDDLPPVDSPLRNNKNVILTAHGIGSVNWGIDPELPDLTAKNCLNNLERFKQGEPVKFVITERAYNLMT